MSAQLSSQHFSQGVVAETLPHEALGMVAEKKCLSNQLAVSFLSLANFRCYEQQYLEVDRRPIVLTGANGTGKTNLLEALSLLVPGRGLRRAKLYEIGRRFSGEYPPIVKWGVSADLLVGENRIKIGTGCEYSTLPGDDRRRGDRRIVKIDGTLVKNQAELSQYVSAQWLTPQMDRLFIESTSGRRRFLDQLIYGLDTNHAQLITTYEHSVRSRNKLLREGFPDQKWLSSVEGEIARNGVAIAVRRIEIVERLQKLCRKNNGAFPGAIINVAGQIEDWLSLEPALIVEDRLQAALRDAREKDKNSGVTSIGPHRSDFKVRHGTTGMEAAICSTGEQKSLLVGIVLAFARLQTEQRGYTPLLLLDEVAAHLDENRRESLFGLILDMGAQAWITGTERKLLDAFGNQAQYLFLENNKLIQLNN